MQGIQYRNKVVLVGTTHTGKTSIVQRYVNGQFMINSVSSMQAAFFQKNVMIGGKEQTLEIWDTAGQERFQSLGPTFYRGTDCCILVYDVTKPASFENIKKWRNEFSLQLGLSNASDFPFLLLGNKSDLPDKAVQPSAAREFAQMNGCLLYTSPSPRD